LSCWRRLFLPLSVCAVFKKGCRIGRLLPIWGVGRDISVSSLEVCGRVVSGRCAVEVPCVPKMIDFRKWSLSRGGCGRQGSDREGNPKRCRQVSCQFRGFQLCVEFFLFVSVRSLCSVSRTSVHHYETCDRADGT